MKETLSNMHVEVCCTSSHTVLLSNAAEQPQCCTYVHDTKREPLNAGETKNVQTKTVIKAGHAGDQNPYELTPVTASVPVYVSNQLSGEVRGMRGLCDTPCSPSIISVPIFHKDHSVLRPYGGVLP